jgi:2'-5' RNA ligase
LGSTPADRLYAVARAVEAVARGRKGSDVSLTGLGAFPSARRARVLWVGLDDPAGLLSGLASDLDGALEPLGYRVEARPFTPHLTLARFKVPARLEGLLPELASSRLSPWLVDHVELFRSHLHPRGARYESLARFPLGD